MNKLRRYRITSIALACSAISLVSSAAPNLQDKRNFGGITVFSDHQKSHVFYYLRTKKRLLTKNEVPDFKYDLNRYLGYTQTGNRDEFWVRGVIKFATTTDAHASSYQQIKQQLEAITGKKVRLRSAPISDSYSRLVYSTIENQEGESSVNGEIEGGVVATQKDSESVPATILAPETQRHTIGLSAHDAELFWENFSNDNLSLSLAYGWTIKGVIRDENGEWTDSDTSLGDSLPITVSPTVYPELFSRNELWQRLKYTHSNLMVMCYDFINAADTDLYHVIVEVRFPTVRKQYYRESVKFKATSDVYEQTLEFELANDIKQGYEYRVRRLSVDGTKEVTDWIPATTAFLDVSASPSVLSKFSQPVIEEDL